MARRALLVLVAAAPAGAQPIFIPIEPLAGAPESSATGVSGDGGVVVGRCVNRAFRWSVGELTDLGRLRPNDPYTEAAAASFDGGVVVGTSGPAISATEAAAFRWTRVTGQVEIGRPGLAAA